MLSQTIPIKIMQKSFNFYLLKEQNLIQLTNFHIQKDQSIQFEYQIISKGQIQVEEKSLKIYLCEVPQTLIESIFDLISIHKTIKVLILPNLKLIDESMLIIKQAKLYNIKEVNFNNNLIKNIGVTYIVQSKWDLLEILYLASNKIKNKGLQTLAKADLPKLTFIDLNQTQITNNGMKCLVKAQWPQLKTIILSNNNLSNQSLKIVLTGSFPNLKGLVFQYQQSQNKPFFDPRNASKYDPSWKQTFVMANFQYISKRFTEMIKFKNQHLDAQFQQQLSEEDQA